MEYKDRDWLYQKYITEHLGIYQISELTGIPPRTVHSWLIKFEIPRRKGGVEHWSEEQREYRRRWNKEHPEINRMHGKRHSEETKNKMSEARRSKNNSNWKGGLTELVKGIRRSPEFYQWRKGVLKRDNKTCQDCGSKDKVNAHHIKPIIEYPELIFEISNGLTLCEDCHRRHTSWQKSNGGRKIKSKRRI